MRSGNKNTELFDLVLLKYKFPEPTPVEMKKRIQQVKMEIHKKTLRRAGGYSLIFALISRIYFMARKFGIGISVINSAILLGFFTLLSVLLVSGGIYFALDRFIVVPEPVKKEVSVLDSFELRERGDAAGNKIDADKNSIVNDTPELISQRIGVKPFNLENVSKSRANRATDIISTNLARLRGPEKVINLRMGRKGKKSGMLLFGSVEKLEGIYTVNARVVRVADLKVLFYDSETVFSENEIDGACQKLSEKIYKKLK